jgi:hypothetical protein
MQEEIEQFELWLHRVGDLAKDGNKQARDTLWHAFNRLAWPLAKLAQSDASSIDFDLFQGVLQHCNYMLKRGVGKRDRNALRLAWLLAVELCTLIDQAERDKPGFVADLKTKVHDWPNLKRTMAGVRSHARSTELARMVFGKINLYRQLLDRDRGQIKSRDTLTALTESRQIREANKFREVLSLPNKLDAHSYPEWWEVGRNILRSYWDRKPKEYKRDLQVLAGKSWHSRYSLGQEKQRTYMMDLVKKAFKTLAELPSK